MRFESAVRAVYERAGADLIDPPGAGRLAVMLLGHPCLGYAEQGTEPWALGRRSDGGCKIFVARRLSRVDMAYAIACGLAQWAVSEKLAPAVSGRGLFDLAAHIILPTEALQRCLDDDWTVEEISDVHVCPERVVKTRVRDVNPPTRRSGARLLLLPRIGSAG